jgi:hypothetical protein
MDSSLSGFHPTSLEGGSLFIKMDFLQVNILSGRGSSGFRLGSATFQRLHQ